MENNGDVMSQREENGGDEPRNMTTTMKKCMEKSTTITEK